jgi:hypothetical protein
MFSNTVWFSSVEVEPRIALVLSTIWSGERWIWYVSLAVF